MQTIKNLLILSLLALTTGLAAQVAAPVYVSAYTLYNGEDGLDSDSTTVDSTLLVPVELEARVGVINPGQIDTVHIRLGLTEGGAELLEAAVPYPLGIPDSLPLHPYGNGFAIGLGEYMEPDSFMLEVWLQDLDGELSPPTLFNSND